MKTAIPIIVAALVLASCGEDTRPAADPERIHCQAALEKLSKDVSGVHLNKVRDWVADEAKNVTINYDYIAPKEGSQPERELSGFVLCRYGFDYRLRHEAGRIPKATAIRYRGINLADSELILLNSAIAGR